MIKLLGCFMLRFYLRFVVLVGTVWCVAGLLLWPATIIEEFHILHYIEKMASN